MSVVTNRFGVAVSRVAAGYSEHPPKRQQQAADAKAPEITRFHVRKRREARSPGLKGLPEYLHC